MSTRRKNIYVMFILALFVTMGFFSCESSDSSDSNGSGTSELAGTWIYDLCDDNAVDVESETDKYVLSSGNSGSRTSYNYNALGCGVNSLELEFVENFTYQVGDVITTSDGDTAKKINFTTQSIWVTVRDQNAVNNLNTDSMCGFNDWALDVPRDITGLTCGTDQVDSQGTVNYDIYKVSGGKSYFGDDEGELYDGGTDADRPRKLKSSGYTKS